MAGPDDNASPLALSTLSQRIESGHVDTVLVVFTDMQGRLQGKRVHGRFFLDDTLQNGIEGCNYLLAVDVDMNTVSGYELASWESGYGDFVLRPDMSTLRAAPWLPGTAMVQCDLAWPDGQPVRPSPRQVLQEQIARAEDIGCVALAGTELEFLVFRGSYQDAWESGYTNLRPATRYNVDYSIVGTSGVEPLMRDLRNSMYSAGLVTESSKGECNLGQQELTFQYDTVLRTADQHVVFKSAAKELANRHDMAVTFMAKYDAREGNSCHIHMSLRGIDGSPVFGDHAATYADPASWSPVFATFLAGVMWTMRDFTLLYAPNVNSYKRFARGTFAPTVSGYGLDNRTCALRVVGHGDGLRVENRLPGADANPYLALSAMLAGGLWNLTRDMPTPLGPAISGSAYDIDPDDVDPGLRLPRTLHEAKDVFAGSELANLLLGEDVVKHYAHAAEIELEAYDGAVTDWERTRGFERL